jgi:cell division protein FtsQ
VSRRIVGNYRGPRAHGASVAVPARNRESLFAAAGRVLLVMLGLALTALIAVGVREAFLQVNNQKINVVQIEGNLANLSRSELEETVSRFVADSLVSLDLDRLKASLEEQPWINSAEVRRVWPDRLIIRVREEVAIARWGENQLLNQEGKSFAPPSIEGHRNLPYLSGPPGSQELMMRQYLQFNQLLYPLGVRITDLELSDRQAWTLRFSNTTRNGVPVDVVVRVGKEDVLARMKRLVAFLETVSLEGLQDVASLDLRYSNGVAVMPLESGRGLVQR